MKKSELACRAIRAATTESQVITAVRDYLVSLEPAEVAGIPIQVLSTGLTEAEELIHSALHVVQDRASKLIPNAPGTATLDETCRVLTTAARRLAAINGHTT